MRRFIEGEDRGQGTLRPGLLDDYVAEDNPVRVVDVFVEEYVLAYNLKRLMALLGIAGIMDAIRAYALFLRPYGPLRAIILITLPGRLRRSYGAIEARVAC